MKIKKEFIIHKQTGISLILFKTQYIRVIDIEGKQVADLFAYNLNNYYEKLSTAATLDALGRLFIKKGDCLFSNRYSPMLKIVEDTVGKHDILHPACSNYMFKHQYKLTEYHPSCLENLNKSLEEFGIIENDIYTPLNIFMNTTIDPNGKIHIAEPISHPGDYIELSAEMDLIVAITACSVEESRCNAFHCTSIKVQVL
jgi:uncharacterized protein YcgI (DUF1989 family)